LAQVAVERQVQQQANGELEIRPAHGSLLAAVAYAREGKGAVRKLPPECSVSLADMLGPAIPDRHNLALLSVPRPDGGCAVARLYGGPAEVIQLGKFDELIPQLKRPVVFLVNYVNHKIEQPTIDESAIEDAKKNGAA
jgi:hypothetical protein